MQLRMQNVGPAIAQTAQVTIYDGVGTGGTVLAQQTATVTAATAQTYTVVFPTPAAVVNTQDYTIGVVSRRGKR